MKWVWYLCQRPDHLAKSQPGWDDCWSPQMTAQDIHTCHWTGGPDKLSQFVIWLLEFHWAIALHRSARPTKVGGLVLELMLNRDQARFHTPTKGACHFQELCMQEVPFQGGSPILQNYCHRDRDWSHECISCLGRCCKNQNTRGRCRLWWGNQVISLRCRCRWWLPWDLHCTTHSLECCLRLEYRALSRLAPRGC